MVGFVDTTSVNPATHFPDPLLFAVRPLIYGTVVTDTFTITGSPALGIVTINPDAYGTLILPYGTLINILRVKITEVHPWFTVTTYVWFDGTITSALLKIEENSEVEYLLNETLGIAENEKQKNFSFYPNPATKQILFESEDTGELSIANNLGQVTFQTFIKDKQTVISTDNLNAGIYHITFCAKKCTTVSELVIQ